MLLIKFIIVKKNIEKLLKSGKKQIIFIALLIIYIIYTVIFYIHSLVPDGILHAPNKPLPLYLIKWIYAIVLLVGILKINVKPHLSYMVINTISVCILLLSFVSLYYWFFYVSFVDILLLEIITIGLIIATNLNNFITENLIERKFTDFIVIIALPIIITIIIKCSFEYFYYG